MSIGDRIRKLREEKGVSLQRLAREMHVSVQEVEAWESGEQTPETGKLLVMAAVLGTQAEYLQYGTVSHERKASSRPQRTGSLFLIAAMVLYFIGVGTGEFSQQMALFGLPLLNYGTTPLAIILLTTSAVCLVLGIRSKLRAVKNDK